MIGKRIKELRTQSKLTQAQLAIKLGTTQKQVSKWEIGYLEPNIEMIRKIAIVFEVTADYLLELEDEAGRKEYSDEFSYSDGTHKITHKRRK